MLEGDGRQKRVIDNKGEMEARKPREDDTARSKRQLELWTYCFRFGLQALIRLEGGTLSRLEGSTRGRLLQQWSQQWRVRPCSWDGLQRYIGFGSKGDCFCQIRSA